MKKILLVAIFVIGISTLSACSQPTAAPLPTLTPTYSLLIVVPTQAPTAQLPTATLPPLPTATTATFVPIQAEIIFDNYLLRIGPGRMFESIDMYDTGERVMLLGREPGNNWVLVQTKENYSG